MMRLRDLNLIRFMRHEREREICPLLFTNPINFSETILTRRAIISLKKINFIEEETMKAITKQLSINQLGISRKIYPHSLPHIYSRLLLTSFNASYSPEAHPFLIPFLKWHRHALLSSFLSSDIHLRCQKGFSTSHS